MKRTKENKRPGAAATNRDRLDIIYSRPGFKLRRAHQLSQSIFVEEFGDFDLTPTQCGLLYMISQFPGLDQMSLSRLLGLDRSTTSFVVKTLEGRDLINRSIDAEDRRRLILRPTKLGLALLIRVQPALDQAQERFLRPLSSAERKSFLALLDKVIEAHNAGSRVQFSPAAVVSAPC